MPLENNQIEKIFEDHPIDGVDFADGLGRFGGQAKIYLRIVKSFIQSTPEALDLLAAVTGDTLANYAVLVHGLKGSCYGISALKVGDEAKALEFASKAEDWAVVERDNPLLIRHTLELIEQFRCLVDYIEQADAASADPRALVEEPDPCLLQRLLDATKSFDVEAMGQAIAELDTVRYRREPELVATFKQQLTNFRYDLIEEKAQELLR